MSILNRIRTVGAASLLAVAVVGLTAAQADARPKKPGTPKATCSLPGSAVYPPTNPPVDTEIFNEGDWAQVVDSSGRLHIVQCGADGNWHVVRYGEPAGQTAPPPVVNAP